MEEKPSRKRARGVETKRWSESEVNKDLHYMLEQYKNLKVIFLLYVNFLQRYFIIEGVHDSRLAIEYPNCCCSVGFKTEYVSIFSTLFR